MYRRGFILVALSGGVDSAVAALLLKRQGHDVQCLHMTNWEDDGYCESAQDFRDARSVCSLLDVPLHRVNFAREYRERVFRDFLDEIANGRTPNPDVVCNREIKFGVLKRYAERLGANRLATGHYARLERRGGQLTLLKARDTSKDQSYFLHAVRRADFEDVEFPLGDLHKARVREIAAEAGMHVADKRDSTGICFIGERPFATFLKGYVPPAPGRIRTADGEDLGSHAGLAFYTVGQRQGLAIGGRSDRGGEPWYVAHKDTDRNELIVVQGADHPLLYSARLVARGAHWIDGSAGDLAAAKGLRCHAKTRYRQPDQACTVQAAPDGFLEICFDLPQRAVTPGQYVVLYDGDVCLGGATIEATMGVSSAAAATL